VHRNQPTTAVLGGVIPQLYGVADLAAGIQHHVPRQTCDLAGAHARFRRQQDYHAIADRVPATIGEGKEIHQIGRCENFSLFAEHAMHPNSTTKYALI